jgi:hypothetical protein
MGFHAPFYRFFSLHTESINIKVNHCNLSISNQLGSSRLAQVPYIKLGSGGLGQFTQYKAWKLWQAQFPDIKLDNAWLGQHKAWQWQAEPIFLT